MRQSFSAILSSDSLFSRAIYIGFNILINLYNQMGGKGVQKSLFFVITDTCVTIEATMNRHSQMCCDSVCLPLEKNQICACKISGGCKPICLHNKNDC
jgi:hypothetical protein